MKLFNKKRLGIILGSKIFINFKKYDFEECTKRLSFELSHIFGSQSVERSLSNLTIKEEVKTSKTSNQTIPTETKKEVNKQDWTESDVEKWFIETKINSKIYDYLKPMNGQILHSLYKVLRNSPDFFYNTIRSDCAEKMNLKDIAYFSSNLESIFSGKN